MTETPCFKLPRRYLTGWLILMGGSFFGQIAWSAACPLPADSAAQQWRGERAWTALAAQGYRIGTVNIVVDNVFDLDNPTENSWYAHLANTLHIKTHPKAIREQLLFKPGDAVDSRVIYESVRRLHALKFLRYADIEPGSCNGRNVDVLVQAKDAWTLKLDFEFAHVGGQNTSQFEVTDSNFLGTGKALALGHTYNPQRSANLLSYQDPSLFGSHWQLATTYEDLSDGHIKVLNIGQPFYEDQTPWSLQASFYDQKQGVYFYNDGVLAWIAPSTLQQHAVSWAHLIDWFGDSGTRAGVFYTDSDYAYGAPQPQNPGVLPEPVLLPRQLAGVGLSWEFFQDRYASYTNMEFIDRPEDYNLGWIVDFDAGHYGKNLGGDVSASFYGVSASWGAALPGDTLLLASGFVNERQQNGESRNLLSNLSFTASISIFPGRHWWRMRSG
ncbi:MAG: hypothetical protein ACRER7_07680, partial [Gammaproteobacteria bacterium]